MAKRKVLRWKKRPASSALKKTVQAITKKTLKRAVETKNRVLVNTTTFGSSSWSTPLYVNVAQGADSVNRIGDKITAVGVKWRGWVGMDPAIITTNRSFAAVRLMFVSGKRPLTSGDMPTFKGQIDPEIMTVHYDKYINFTDTDLCKYFQLWIPYKKNVLFAGGQPTKNELYMFMIPDAKSGLTTTTGFNSDGNLQLYWKDP